MSAQDAEWQHWLQDNLARNCAPIELYQIMRTHGFSVSTIKIMMGTAYPTGIELSEGKSDIDHLAISKVMDNAKPFQINKFDSDLIQLYTIEDFLTEDECEKIIQLTESQLRPSTVTHSNGDYAFRTSETCDLESTNDSFVTYIDEKIAQALGIRLPYSEPIQAQRYAVSQEFKAHHDYFLPDTEIYKKFAATLGQRTWTFMIYLNATPKGGGTQFAHLGHTFYPKPGMAVIWNNLLPDGTPNRNTLHHGMPVEAGKKVIITKWFREKGHGEMFY